mmetsp:Transcript_33385/g.49001  ORF Transcript_33385/g.49001 Transcript_33385/m.49001 type:complete len:389 (-) Transcript_33385:12-1178(-)
MVCQPALDSNLEKLCSLNSQSFKEQAIWFLNANDAGPEDCELVWQMHKKSVALEKSKEDGTQLDEFSAHLVLESAQKACTRKEMREQLTNINPNYKKVSLLELLIYNFGSDWELIVNAPQYDQKKEKEAQAQLKVAKNTLMEATKTAQKASNDAEKARIAEENALLQQRESSKAAALLRIAEEEFSKEKVQANETLERLKLEESQTICKKEELEKISRDENLGIVKRNRAKAELSAIQNQDSLPLRAAKIQNEAALKKLTRAAHAAGKAAKDAEIALGNAKKTQYEANQARRVALETGKVAEAIKLLAKEACDRVEEVLNEVLRDKKAGKGTIFYIERELQEAKKFMPKSKFAAAKQAAENAMKKAIPENQYSSPIHGSYAIVPDYHY